MKFAGALLLWLISPAGPLSGQVNPAYPVLPPHPASGIVPGSRFMIARYPLGLAAEEQRPDPSHVSPSLIRIEVEAPGRIFAARVITVTDTRVEALLPRDVPHGPATVRAFVRDEKKLESTVQVIASAPGLYTHTDWGTQLMADRVGLASPARPGAIVRLRGNGFGAAPQPQSVEMRIGAVAARVVAIQAGADGDDLIDVEIPRGGKEGCFVPVVARVRDKWTNFGSLPIVSGEGPCRLVDLAEGAFSRPAEQGQIRVGRLELGRSPFWVGGKIRSRKDRLSGRFEQLPISSLTGLPPNGTCTVSGSRWGVHRPGIAIPVGEVTLRGGKVSWTVTPVSGFIGAQREDAPWFARPFIGIEKDSFVGNGPHTLKVEAGRDVESFSLQIPIQTRSPKWINLFPGPVPRDRDLKLRWTGGRVGDFAVIRLTQAGGEALCVQAAEAGSFTIPVWILETLPKPDPATAQLSLEIFAAPQTASPKGLDSFSFTFREQDVQQISFR